MSAPQPIVFVVRHTHWDREWYHPAPVFRKRLVDLIDDLLSEPNAPFLLDGQAIVLRDYLAVRPERASELASALQGGRLEAGPWYVLPDELIPGGEALVRNLLAGRRALRSLRASPPPVLYCPDSFGHPAALPAIAAGFGFGLVIVWRGYGSRRWPAGDTAWWRAPGGDEALLFHLPPNGYEFGANLPTDKAHAERRWHEMRRVLEARSALGVLLVMNGADHHAPQPQVAIDALGFATSPLHTIVGGLTALARQLLERARTAELPRVTGELRDSYGYTWTLQGTFGTRAHQKRANAIIERTLTRDVEPWAALSRMRGARSSRHHVNTAWETLLACHPHDSLCGCAIDEVAQAVDTRLAEAAALASELRAEAMSTLLGHNPDAARANSAAWKQAVIVRNRAPRARGGVAEIDLDVELTQVPVGPGSAGRSRPVNTHAELDLQILERERRYARIEAPSRYPINHEIERRRCLVWLTSVPPLGLVALPLGDASSTTDELPTARVVTGDARGIRSASGSLTSRLRWQSVGRRSVARPLFDFEITGDRGDTYTPSLVAKSTGRGVLKASKVTLRGPLRAAIDSTWHVAVRKGDAPRAAVDVETRTAVDAGADFVRVHVSGVNTACDHRLRILFSTGLRPRRVLADAAFAIVERKPLRIPPLDQSAEASLPTAPLHRFVTMFDGGRGCTLVSDGLAEYEVLGDGTLAVTLVRAVGELSRADLPERPGHAGWPEETPGAQSIGLFEANFAIAWHRGDTPATRADILALVDDALLPLTGDTRRDLVTIPPPIAGIALEGAGLAFSALKESDDGQYIVARCVNVTDEEVRGAWVLPRPAFAIEGRLDETAQGLVKVAGERVPIAVPPRGIQTVLIGLDSNTR